MNYLDALNALIKAADEYMDGNISENDFDNEIEKAKLAAQGFVIKEDDDGITLDMS